MSKLQDVHHDLIHAARKYDNPNRDQIAHAIMVYSWSADAMKDMASPIEGYELADMVIAALGVEEDE